MTFSNDENISGQFSLNLSKRIRLTASDKPLIARLDKTYFFLDTAAWSVTNGPCILLLRKISLTPRPFKYNLQHTKRNFSV